MSLKRIDEVFNFEKGVLQSSKSTPGNYDFITASAEWKTHKDYTHDCEALIFAAAASGSLGRTHYVNGKFISSDLCFIITPKDPKNLPVDLKFYHLLFNFLRDEIVRNTKAGTSKEAIGLTSFGKYEIPYFAIEKQKETKKKFLRVHESKVSIAYEFHSQQDLLTQLRQSFLREAMQGKLVNQDPKDGHAKDLLERIKAEKAGSGRKEKEPPPLKREQIPFEIPENWVWCRLGEILSEIKYGTSQSCDYDSSKNSPVLRIPNVSGRGLNIEDLKYANLNDKERRELSLEENDILIIRSNGSRDLVGKTVLVTNDVVGYAYAGYLVRLRYNKTLINPKYIWYSTTAPYFRNLIETPLRTTVGINNINTEEMSNLSIPIPPLLEQIRIIKKLDDLMKLCDGLRESIHTSTEKNELLLQQTLREALAK